MWKLVIFALFAVTVVHAGKYNGFKLFEITPRTRQACMFLHGLSQNERDFDFFRLSRWPGEKALVIVSPEAEQDFQHNLEEKRMHYKILNENVEQMFEREISQNRLLQKLRPYSSDQGRLSTDRYYSHNEINAYIEDLAKRYPTRVFVKTVGRSYEKRWMKTITITNGDGRPNKNVILMDGGFHAREWISPAAVLYAIEQLVERFEENSELLLDYDWVILPVVNPDGYEYTQINADTRIWRKTRKPSNATCIGTDPNRNFDFHWNEEGASPDPCSNTFAGTHAFSEPEAVVVRDLIHSFRGRGMFYLTVHAQGRLILYPWGWIDDVPDTVDDLHEVAKAGADAIYEYNAQVWKIGSSTSVLYVAAGASDDYAFNEGYPISFTMELPPGGATGHDPPPEQIDPFVKETWVGIRAMAKRVTEKYLWENK